MAEATATTADEGPGETLAILGGVITPVMHPGTHPHRAHPASTQT